MSVLKDMSRREKFGLLMIAAALIALPFMLASAGTAWVRITNFAVLFVLLSLGLNIVVGFAGLLDLGYVAFYAVGAYVYACWRRRISACTCRSGSSCRSAPPWPASPVSFSARRPCACAATTLPSSPSASARSCASS
jgi:ABC-type branched-subunit amino acid transport system permease subunit